MLKFCLCKSLLRCAIMLLCGLLAALPLRAQSHLVWHDKPATQFTEAHPLGNGRLGAMIFGGTNDETVVLNESGMWSGSPQDADRPHAADHLPEIRRLLFAGENAAAEKLMNAVFTCQGAGSGHGKAANLPYGCYQTLGKLRIHFLTSPDDRVDEYRRELDLRDAIARVSYVQGNVHHSREAFVSAVDQVFAYRLHADKDKTISCDVILQRDERNEVSTVGNNELVMTGQLADGVQAGQGVRYCARLWVQTVGGSVTAVDGTLQVRDASSVLLLASAATDNPSLVDNPMADPEAATRTQLDAVADTPFEEMRQRHTLDFHRYYDRVSLRLGGEGAPADSPLPTNARLLAFTEGTPDNELAALYFNFGRYLLISSSRPGGRPANLQGIWAEQIQTPWNGDWHLNINVQMNYWPAEVCNLSDLHEPLFRLIESLVEPGHKTARCYYDAGGWVAHVLANPWGFTSPGESASWGSTSTCSAWLCQHLWDHYLFTQDLQFLREVYPILKGSAQFYLDALVEDTEHGWLVTAPSNSPENSYLDENGQQVRICIGSTMDMQLLRYLFDACSKAAELLEVDEAFQHELQSAAARLAPTRIGSDGRIMEWNEEYTEAEPTHRHVSHLWGLYPGFEIDERTTPTLAAAARKTLEARGDSGTGWGLANKMAMWTRLHDGARAHLLLRNHLHPVGFGDLAGRWTGGTYPNLFDAHPPFQIDGNFGGTTAIAEMLLQSLPPDLDNDRIVDIELLPALPPAWPDGEFRGFQARGGFDVSAKWQDGKLVSAEIHSKNGLPARVHCQGKTVELNLDKDSTAVLDDDL